MSDPAGEPETGGRLHRSTPGVPRWVTVLGVAAAVLVLVLLLLVVVGGGSHGPGRHLSTGNQGALAAVVVASPGHGPFGEQR